MTQPNILDILGAKATATPSSATSESRIPTLAQLVKEAHNQGYSDIHLGVGRPPYFRNHGIIERTNYPLANETHFWSWMEEILNPAEIDKFREQQDFDGASEYEFTRVRINAFMTLRGAAMVLRLIPLQIKTLDELGLPEVFKKLSMDYRRGLILLTGETGSGKSTTLAAMIDHINRHLPKHIVTIEDPIEFVHQNHKSLINQREVGMHTSDFDRALRAVLREDPDIILIGEMRDRNTVSTALKAAQTGHLVLGTLHTNSAVASIERLLNIYEPPEQEVMRIQIAEALVAVVSQILVRTYDGKRTVAQEIMLNTDAIKDWIQRGEIDKIEAVIPESRFDGMQTMNQALYHLYQRGKISQEEALAASPKANEMIHMIKGAGSSAW
ncbi:MAG: type IV pilus twitching motility protein PilT [Cyanobacteriota bacterium]|nr:type IV pilus twitching motility protein PilT [Cyanobacteriota bacterium]